jgi:replication factor A1
VQFHYALVDDLLSREEFERRVEEKMQECGDMVDETTAAMLVVKDCGRHHVKIEALDGRSSLFSFFGKVISKSEAKEFLRPEGEKGLVTNLILGDETGQVRAVLWDEKAMAAEEIDLGDVLEIIGRRTGRSGGDINVLALRKAVCDIQCQTSVEPRLSPPKRRDVEVCLIAREEPRQVSRRDGTTMDLCEAVVGIEEELCRLVCWQPELIENLPEGSSIRITGALEKYRQAARELVVDETSTISPGEEAIGYRLNNIDEIREEGIYSVGGTVRSVQPARTFTRRDGQISHVKNIVITGGDCEIRVVIWGERALMPVLPGERTDIYLGKAREGRFGDVELHVGQGSFLRVIPGDHQEEIEMTGTVIATRHGLFIDDGDHIFLIDGNLPHGSEFRVRGIMSGQRLALLHAEPVRQEVESVRDRALAIRDAFT